jgi:hypothetical protein
MLHAASTVFYWRRDPLEELIYTGLPEVNSITFVLKFQNKQCVTHMGGQKHS